MFYNTENLWPVCKPLTGMLGEKRDSFPRPGAKRSQERLLLFLSHAGTMDDLVLCRHTDNLVLSSPLPVCPCQVGTHLIAAQAACLSPPCHTSPQEGTDPSTQHFQSLVVWIKKRKKKKNLGANLHLTCFWVEITLHFYHVLCGLN